MNTLRFLLGGSGGRPKPSPAPGGHKRLACLLLGWLAGCPWGAGGVHAHELEAPKGTVVLRPGPLIQLSFRIPLSAALKQVLAPDTDASAFWVAQAAMPSEVFKAQWQQAQQAWERQTQVSAQGAAAQATPRVGPSSAGASPDNKGELRATLRWRWPSAQEVQSGLQQRLMQAMATPHDHSHEASFEIQAEARWPGVDSARLNTDSIRLQLPDSWGRVLVVNYQPRQQWIDAGQAQSLSFPSLPAPGPQRMPMADRSRNVEGH
jgi:hypothetical protein